MRTFCQMQSPTAGLKPGLSEAVMRLNGSSEVDCAMGCRAGRLRLGQGGPASKPRHPLLRARGGGGGGGGGGGAPCGHAV